MTFQVLVPASTSNLGSGFDCISLALQLWLTVTIAERPGDLEIRVSGQGADELPHDHTNLVFHALTEYFRQHGRELPPMQIRIENQIPVGRGLGSSGAAIVAGLLAGQKLLGGEHNPAALLDLANQLEGHAENVSASLFGGLTLNCTNRQHVLGKQISVDREITAVLYVPEIAISTREARAMLPASVSHADAVFNLQRSALLIHCFQARDYSGLKMAIQDKLHQPYRKTLIPSYDRLEVIAYENGALGVCISGSGSAILALATKHKADIVAAWEQFVEEDSVAARVLELAPDNAGAQVKESGAELT